MSDAVEAARRIAREFVDQHPEGCRFYENLPHGDAMDVCRALLAAVEGGALTPRDERAVTDNGWQPIETAPRDGAIILVGFSKSETLAIAYWEDGFWFDDADDCAYIGSGPTHWMPLPAPPGKDTLCA